MLSLFQDIGASILGVALNKKRKTHAEKAMSSAYSGDRLNFLRWVNVGGSQSSRDWRSWRSRISRQAVITAPPSIFRSSRVSEVVILVGGKGSRLRSVVADRPKPMAEVAGRPFVEWVLLLLRAQDVRRVVLCTGYMAEAFEAYFGDGSRWNMELEYSREPIELGTAGAVRHALPKLRSDRFFVLNGDSYCDADTKRLEEAHLTNGARATLWLVRTGDAGRYGSVEIGPDGAVRGFCEKEGEGRASLINAGVYLLGREVVSSIPEGRMVSFETEFFPALIGHGLYAVVGDAPFFDIGTPEAYAAAQRFFKLNVRL